MSIKRIWQLAACVALCQSPLKAQATAVIRGRILTDSAERPIAGAEVALADRRFVATSDSLGRFRIAGVPAGRYAVTVRRLGYAPASATVTLTPNDSTEADFLLAAVAQELPTVEVETTLLQRKLADFEDRRRFGIGHFLTEAQIEKAPGTRLSEKLRHLPGLTILYPRSGSTFRVASTGPPDVQIAFQTDKGEIVGVGYPTPGPPDRPAASRTGNSGARPTRACQITFAAS